MDRDQRLEQARQICRQGDFDVAYRIYDSLLQAYPNDPEILRDYGRAKYQEYDNLGQAAQLFAQAHAAAPTSVELLLWRADLSALGYGDGYAAAAALYRQALQIDPQAVDAYIGLGMLHRVPGKPVSLDEAITAFRQAVEIDPQRADAHLDLGMALIEAGQHHAARESLRAGQRLLHASGNDRQAQSVQAVLDRLDRNEIISSLVYTLDSARYR